MTVHASMDIETLSTRAQAVVLSIGMCFFDDAKVQTFDEIVDSGIELFFDRDSQVEKGRHIMPSTIQWWNQQGEEARRVLEAEDVITPRDFYPHFEAFCEKSGLNSNWVKKYCKWYIRGPHFDISITDNLFEDYNVDTPWKYFKVRDIRTWLECNGLEDNAKLVKPSSMVAHNALHDAAFDAYMMQQVLHNPLDKLELAA